MKLKKVLSLFFILLFVLVLIPGVSAASVVTDGLVTDDLSKKCASPEGCDLCEFVGLFVNGADIMLVLSGTFSILMFVFGGLIMIIAYGNEARFKWGKDMIVATLIGILIVFFAWTLVNLIIGSLFGNSDFDWANANGVCSSSQ